MNTKEITKLKVKNMLHEKTREIEKKIHLLKGKIEQIFIRPIPNFLEKHFTRKLNVELGNIDSVSDSNLTSFACP